MSTDAESPPPIQQSGVTGIKTTRVRDWGTFIISIVALTISITTAYFTLVRKVDDIRLTIQGRPTLSMDVPNQKIVFFSDQNLNFVNLGTRAAAITSIVLYVTQPDNESSPACEPEIDATIASQYLTVKPFIIPAGEIRIEAFRTKIEVVKIPVKDSNRRKDRILVDA